MLQAAAKANGAAGMVLSSSRLVVGEIVLAVWFKFHLHGCVKLLCGPAPPARLRVSVQYATLWDNLIESLLLPVQNPLFVECPDRAPHTCWLAYPPSRQEAPYVGPYDIASNVRRSSTHFLSRTDTTAAAKAPTAAMMFPTTLLGMPRNGIHLF